MTSTSELYAAAIDAIGAKKVARALGLSLSHTYRFAREPFGDENLDGTGAKNDLDRIEQLIDVMGGHPHARPALVQWRLFFERAFNSALNETQGRPLSPVELRTKCTAALREIADLIDAAHDSDIDRERVIREALEARDVCDRIIASMDHPLLEVS